MATKRITALPRLAQPTSRYIHTFHRPLASFTFPKPRLHAQPLQTRQTIPQTLTTPTHRQTRHHSTPPTKTHQYDYPSIRDLSTTPSPQRILIDVREPSEYTPGHIPTAHNLPLKSSPEALMLPAEEFEERFGFEKPRVDQEVVFYCRSGVRSSAAARLAEEAGFERVGEYRGSWVEWEKEGGVVERGE